MPDGWPDSMQDPVCRRSFPCIYPRHKGVPVQQVSYGQSFPGAIAQRLLRGDERVGIAGDAYTENRHGLWLSVAATANTGVGSSVLQVVLTNSASCRKASAMRTIESVAEANARERPIRAQRARGP